MDKKLASLMVIFFLSFGFLAFIIIFNKPLTQFTRAKEDLTPSAQRSKMIAWPFPSIKADGHSKSTINIFILSESGKPLANKVVTITSTFGQLDSSSAITNNNGRATFNISSPVPGIAEIEAIVEPNIKLASKLTLKFE